MSTPALIIVILLGVGGFVTWASKLCDGLLFTDAQKKALSGKFETWWDSAKRSSRLELSLKLANGTTRLFDKLFGESLWSKQMMVKCFACSSCLLSIALAILGITNHYPFGGPPWVAYSESVKYVLNVTDELSSATNHAKLLSAQLTEMATNNANIPTNTYFVTIHSNTFLMTVSTNQLYRLTRIEPIGHGFVTIYYERTFMQTNTTTSRTNDFGSVTTIEESLDSLLGDFKRIHDRASAYARNSYKWAYTVTFYVLLFVLNAILFFVSAVFARAILREIGRAKSFLSVASLVFTNGIVVFALCAVVVLLLTILAIPLFWVFIPSLYVAAEQSWYAVFAALTSAAFALLLSVGVSTKVVLFIALLPSCGACLIGVVSAAAVKFPNCFHWIVKSMVIRCVEKNPFVVLGTCAAAGCAIIAFIAKYTHFFGFM